jgi:RNA polymerase sigma factor (TIGR02999 family)
MIPLSGLLYFGPVCGWSMTDVTRIINAIQQGDNGATNDLLPLVYEELRRLAAQKLSHEKPGQTLQATALVHEAYLRLVGTEDPHWDGKGHFFAAAAEAMRRILVENARRKGRIKYGGNLKRVELDEAGVSDFCIIPPEDLIALDEALEQFAQESPTATELVKLWYFGGLSIDQAAEALNIPRSTAYRHWSFARAWLYARISGR